MAIPPGLFEFECFEDDEDDCGYLDGIRSLPKEALFEYIRILERMMFMWPCELNVRYYRLLYYTIDLEIEMKYRLEMGKNLLEFLGEEEDCDETLRFVEFTLDFVGRTTTTIMGGGGNDDDALEPVVRFDMMTSMLRHPVLAQRERMTTTRVLEALFEWIVSNPGNEKCVWLFRCEKHLRKEWFSGYIRRFYNSYADDDHIYNRIMVWQYVLNHPDRVDQTIVDLALFKQHIRSVLEDARVYPANVRSDVADMVLHVRPIHKDKGGSAPSDDDDHDIIITDDLRRLAVDVITEAGGNRLSFYHNQENVHSIEDAAAILPILKELSRRFHDKIPEQSRDLFDTKLESVFRRVIDNNMQKGDDDVQHEPWDSSAIKKSLVRIETDHQYYHGYRLSQILDFVIAFIRNADEKQTQNELWRRLFEELRDMVDKCSTGYALRLLNTLSGFDDQLSLTIPEEERFRSIFYHKFNSRLQNDIKDPDLQTEIMYEMTLPSSEPGLRIHFLDFFRQVFPSIAEEMMDEFRDILTETDIDLYLRKAFSDYETGG